MLFKIKTGHHRAWPWNINFWFSKRMWQWDVCFNESCRYLITDNDQEDTNKLCGIGFLPGHHTDSARFGWRYDWQKDKIELIAYFYVAGERIIRSLGFCNVDETYKLALTHAKDLYYLAYWSTSDGQTFIGPPEGSTIQPISHRKKFKYALGIYFGGNKPAPHTMYIGLLKKKV